MMKTLILDIETSPNLVHTWGLWKQNVGINQIQEPTEILCWAAKWYDEDEVMFSSIIADEKEGMLLDIWQLLDMADAVVHYNGQSFDIPHINREFLEAGFLPPAPYKQIDLLKTAKSVFKFPSNKLDYIVTTLKIGEKVKHEGHELWTGCLLGDEESWDKMEEYNKADVMLTEKLYERFRPWIKGMPNAALYQDETDTLACPLCGRTDTLHPRGFAYTAVSKFQRYRCECGKWCRGNVNLVDRSTKGVNIV
jgi:hypothetical protein